MSADARPLARGPADGQVRIYNPTGWQSTMRAAADAWNRTGVTPTIVSTGHSGCQRGRRGLQPSGWSSAATRTTAATGTPNAMGAGGASPCARPTATLTGTLPPQGCGSPRTSSVTSSACRMTPTDCALMNTDTGEQRFRRGSTSPPSEGRCTPISPPHWVCTSVSCARPTSQSLRLARGNLRPPLELSASRERP